MAYSISLSFRCCSAVSRLFFWLNTHPNDAAELPAMPSLLGFGLRRSLLATTHDVPQVLRATMVT